MMLVVSLISELAKISSEARNRIITSKKIKLWNLCILWFYLTKLNNNNGIVNLDKITLILYSKYFCMSAIYNNY